MRSLGEIFTGFCISDMILPLTLDWLNVLCKANHPPYPSHSLTLMIKWCFSGVHDVSWGVMVTQRVSMFYFAIYHMYIPLLCRIWPGFAQKSSLFYQQSLGMIQIQTHVPIFLKSPYSLGDKIRTTVQLIPKCLIHLSHFCTQYFRAWVGNINREL